MALPDPWTVPEIDALLEAGNVDDLVLIPIAVTNLGTPDAAWSEAICQRLSSHSDPGVRGNAVLGLGHLARTTRQLSRERSVPIVVAGLDDPHEYVRMHAGDAASDIEHYLHWRMPPWDALYAKWSAARAARSPTIRALVDIALKRIRNLCEEDLAWLEGALTDDERRWFVAGLFRKHPLPRRLLAPMLDAALRGADASEVRGLIRPCTESFGAAVVVTYLDGAYAGARASATAIHAARYWAKGIKPTRGPSRG